MAAIMLGEMAIGQDQWIDTDGNQGFGKEEEMATIGNPVDGDNAITTMIDLIADNLNHVAHGNIVCCFHSIEDSYFFCSIILHTKRF